MNFTVEELAKMIGGEVEGDSTKRIDGVAGLQEAGGTKITFAVAPYLDYLHLAKAGAVVIPSDAEVNCNSTLIRVANPRASFIILSQAFQPELVRVMGIHANAHVDPTAEVADGAIIMNFAYVGPQAKIGKGTILYPHTYIGDSVEVGENCIVYPNVVVREYCQIGDGTIIHSGAVIGADGFGFTFSEGIHKKVPQIGRVIIGNDVEIGANTTIDRGTLGDTIVGNGTKTDNLVHLAHNVQTGEHCLFVAFCGISGSTKIGNHCTFGGQTATKGHMTIGDRCMFAGRSGINHDVPADSVMAGFPIRPHREWLREEAALRQVPELIKRIRTLEQKLEEKNGLK